MSASSSAFSSTSSSTSSSTPSSAPSSASLNTYVDAALALGGFALRDDARARVVENFERIAAIAAVLDAVALAPEDEMAPVFQPQEPA